LRQPFEELNVKGLIGRGRSNGDASIRRKASSSKFYDFKDFCPTNDLSKVSPSTCRKSFYDLGCTSCILSIGSLSITGEVSSDYCADRSSGYFGGIMAVSVSRKFFANILQHG
jgi:hypothetical protein